MLSARIRLLVLHAKSGSSLQNTDRFKCMFAINGLGPLSITSVRIVCPVSINKLPMAECNNFFVVDLPVAVSPKKNVIHCFVVPHKQLANVRSYNSLFCLFSSVNGCISFIMDTSSFISSESSSKNFSMFKLKPVDTVHIKSFDS
nr:C6 protein - rabbit fibroma virus [Rabbit fibroma virus]